MTARGPRAGPPHTGLGCSSWSRQVSRPCAPSGTRRWPAGEGLGPLPPPLPHTDRPPLLSVPRKARRRPGLGAAAPSSPPPAGRAWAAPSPARPPPAAPFPSAAPPPLQTPETVQPVASAGSPSRSPSPHGSPPCVHVPARHPRRRHRLPRASPLAGSEVPVPYPPSRPPGTLLPFCGENLPLKTCGPFGGGCTPVPVRHLVTVLKLHRQRDSPAGGAPRRPRLCRAGSVSPQRRGPEGVPGGGGGGPRAASPVLPAPL